MSPQLDENGAPWSREEGHWHLQVRSEAVLLQMYFYKIMRDIRLDLHRVFINPGHARRCAG